MSRRKIYSDMARTRRFVVCALLQKIQKALTRRVCKQKCQKAQSHGLQYHILISMAVEAKGSGVPERTALYFENWVTMKINENYKKKMTVRLYTVQLSENN